MKYFRLFSSLVLSLVMFAAIFSPTAHAEERKDFLIQQDVLLNDINGTVYHDSSTSFINGSVHDDIGGSVPNVPCGSSFLSITYSISTSDGSLIAKKGEKFHLNIQNMVASITIGNSIYYKRNSSNGSLCLVYTDGTREYLYDGTWNFSSGNATYNYSIDITAAKDIRKIVYDDMDSIHDITFSDDSYNVTLHFSSPVYPFSMVVDIESKEVGLLQKIKDGIGNIVTLITDGFKNLLDSISQLPQNIWNVFSEGLKDLFIPSEDYLIQFADKYELEFADHFGALWQVVDIVANSWGGVMAADQTDTVTFPEASLNFGDTEFKFGGYDVKIVPGGFEFLVSIIKSIVGIVCTVAFVNGLYKRYEEVMGVEQ